MEELIKSNIIYILSGIIILLIVAKISLAIFKRLLRSIFFAAVSFVISNYLLNITSNNSIIIAAIFLVVGLIKIKK